MTYPDISHIISLNGFLLLWMLGAMAVLVLYEWRRPPDDEGED